MSLKSNCIDLSILATIVHWCKGRHCDVQFLSPALGRQVTTLVTTWTHQFTAVLKGCQWVYYLPWEDNPYTVLLIINEKVHYKMRKPDISMCLLIYFYHRIIFKRVYYKIICY